MPSCFSAKSDFDHALVIHHTDWIANHDWTHDWIHDWGHFSYDRSLRYTVHVSKVKERKHEEAYQNEWNRFYLVN